MKKIIYIFVALIAFAIGVFVFYIQPLFLTVRLNSIDENISLYKSQRIIVKGYLVVTKEKNTFYYELVDHKKIKSDGFFPILFLEVPKEVEKRNISLIREIAEENKKLSVKASEKNRGVEGEFLAEVEITGYVRERENEIFGGYYSIVEVTKIKQFSPVKFIFMDELNLKNK